MNGSDEIISGALREMAAQAAPPRLRVEAAWRAGRRRRLTAIATSVAGAAAIAVAVPLAVTGGPGTHPGVTLPGAPALPGRALPEPIEFRQVTAITRPPCRDSYTFASPAIESMCLHLASTGMTVTRIVSAQVIKGEQRAIWARLLPADAREFARLTAYVARQGSPRDELAILVQGQIYSAPDVMQAISGGTFQIVVNSTAQFRYLQRDLGAYGSGIPQSCHSAVQQDVRVTQCR
jgi:hypothetical protein